MKENDFDFKDDIDLLNNQQRNKNKDRFYNVLGYVPFLNVALLFVEKKDESDLTKKFHRQGIAIFLIFIFGFLILSIFSLKLPFIFTLLYLALLVFFMSKAYNETYVEIEFLENIISKFRPKIENKDKNLENNIDPLNDFKK